MVPALREILATDYLNSIKYLIESRIYIDMTVMHDDIDQLLRQHGVQVTAQRLAIMRSVSSRPHATADELTDDVRAVIGSISRQAVYDTLDVLVDRNLVRRIQPDGSAAR
jgi:Fur family transcriptional regulator, stress-responsive regulator